jgi:transcription antitermination factor NusG
MTSNSPPWFALIAKPRHEKSASRILNNKGLESFLPLYQARRQWTDRVQSVDLPLFPGYVFCRFEYERRLAVLTTPGVNSIIGFDNTPAPVPDDEIARIQAIVASGLVSQPWPYTRVGEPIRIDRGALAGMEGILLREKDSLRVVVTVEMLRRSVAVEIDRDMIRPVPDTRRRHVSYAYS